MPPICVSITYLHVVNVTKKVSELKTIVFGALNLQDKVNIKNVQAWYKNRGSFTGRFHISLGLYDKVSWLCGCKKTNTLFCFYVCCLEE